MVRRLVFFLAALFVPLWAWSIAEAAVGGPAITERYVTTHFTQFRGPAQRYEMAVKGLALISRSETADNFVYDTVVKGFAQVAPGNKPVDWPAQGLSFSRDRKTERITFPKGGGRLVTETVNQTLSAVGLEASATGTTTGAINLDLAGDFLPRRLSYTADTRLINTNPPVLLSVIRTEPFGMRAAVKQGAPGSITGRLTHVLVFNPESHRVYQAATTLEASLGDERVRVETLSFLAGEDGRPSYPIADLRKIMPPGLAGQDSDKYVSAPPLWYYQSIKAAQAGELALGTAAEHASNFAVPLIIPCILAVDTAWELTTGVSPLNEMAKQVGEAIGGEQGALYADTLMSYTKLTLSMVSPSIMAVPQKLALANSALETAMNATAMYQSMNSLVASAFFSPEDPATFANLTLWRSETSPPVEPPTMPAPTSLTPPSWPKGEAKPVASGKPNPNRPLYLGLAAGGVAATVGLIAAVSGGEGNGGGGSGRYSLYRGTQDYTITFWWSTPRSSSSSLPLELVVGPDGRLVFPPTEWLTVSQSGNSFTITFTGSIHEENDVVGHYVGTIANSRIEGTIDGTGPKSTCQGSFSLGKVGEYDAPPEQTPETMPHL